MAIPNLDSDSSKRRHNTRGLFRGFVHIFFYIRTQYPENIILSQITFSGPELKSHHAQLLDRGTMDAYRVSLYLDYAFILLGYAPTFFILALRTARKHEDDRWRRFGFIGAFLFLAAGCMDIMENSFLRLMLSEPEGFPNWLALAYSGFASLKWALLVIGSFWLIGVAFALRGKKR